MQLITLNTKVCLIFTFFQNDIHIFNFVHFLPIISEADEILADSSIGGADIKSHEALLGNIGTFAAGSMRKSIILSNGTGIAVHDVSSATGKQMDL